jgi:hypothetical protein
MRLFDIKVKGGDRVQHTMVISMERARRLKPKAGLSWGLQVNELSASIERKVKR